MTIDGHSISEILGAILIILWAVFKFVAVCVCIVGLAWLAYNAFILVLFFLVLGFFAQFKTKW